MSNLVLNININKILDREFENKVPEMFAVSLLE